MIVGGGIPHPRSYAIVRYSLRPYQTPVPKTRPPPAPQQQQPPLYCARTGFTPINMRRIMPPWNGPWSPHRQTTVSQVAKTFHQPHQTAADINQRCARDVCSKHIGLYFDVRELLCVFREEVAPRRFSSFATYIASRLAPIVARLTFTPSRPPRRFHSVSQFGCSDMFSDRLRLLQSRQTQTHTLTYTVDAQIGGRSRGSLFNACFVCLGPDHSCVLCMCSRILKTNSS